MTLSLLRMMAVGMMVFSLLVASLAVGVTPKAQAKTTSEAEQIQALLQVIKMLQERIALKKELAGELVRGKALEHKYTPTDDGKTGRSKITIKKPATRAEFDKQDPDDPIVVTWEAQNIPEDSVVEVELDTVKLTGGSGVGGGIWQGEIPEGDSTGSYEWEVYGEGSPSPGVYRVRVSVRACHSYGCDVNPRFPGQKERIKLYAKSVWRTISVIDEDEESAFDYYKAVLNGRTVDSESDVTEEEADELCSDVYNDYDQYEFGSGDVLKCYWGGDKFFTVDAWKG